LDCKKQISEKFGEKAGEQAYKMAEAFINKLTQEWQQKHGQIQKHSPVDQGDGFSVDGLKEILSRIKGKVEGMGQPEMEEKDDWHPSRHVTNPEKKKELEPHNKNVHRDSYADRAAYLDAAGVKRDEPQDEGMLDKAKEFGKKVFDKIAPGDEELLRQLQKSSGVPAHGQHGKPPMATPNRRQQESAELESIMKLAGIGKK
jgi:hypothetical protein